MRRALPAIGALLVAAVLQVAVAPNLAIGGAVPNFMLLVVVTLALTQGPTAGAASGFAAGLFFDLLSVGPIGPAALVLTVVGYLAGSLSANMFAEGWRLPVTVVLIASITAELAYGVVLAILGAGEPFWGTFISVMLPTAVYNGVLALLAYPFLARLLRQDRQMTTFRRLG